MMKNSIPWIVLLATFVVILLAATTPDVHALPEYAVQTGEPCATCHISPSGGGLRTPRGLAWVADGKQSAVPDLNQALESLGVHRQVDPADYRSAGGPVTAAKAPEAKAPELMPGAAARYSRLLGEYAGN